MVRYRSFLGNFSREEHPLTGMTMPGKTRTRTDLLIFRSPGTDSCAGIAAWCG